MKEDLQNPSQCMPLKAYFVKFALLTSLFLWDDDPLDFFGGEEK